MTRSSNARAFKLLFFLLYSGFAPTLNADRSPISLHAREGPFTGAVPTFGVGR